MTVTSAAAELHLSLIADDAFVCIGAFPGDERIIVYVRGKLAVPSNHGGWPVEVIPIWRSRHSINQESPHG